MRVGDRGDEVRRPRLGPQLVPEVVLLVLMVVIGAPIIEELFFRGFLLPRMNGAFGRGDWVVTFMPGLSCAGSGSQPSGWWSAQRIAARGFGRPAIGCFG